MINIEEIVGLDEKGPIVLNVDNEKTQAKYADKDIFQMSYFEFIASNEQELSPIQIEMLYKINQKVHRLFRRTNFRYQGKKEEKEISGEVRLHTKKILGGNDLWYST